MLTNKISDVDIKNLISEKELKGFRVHTIYTEKLTDFLDSPVIPAKTNDLLILDSNKDIESVYLNDGYFKKASKFIYGRRETTHTVTSATCVVRKAEESTIKDIVTMINRSKKTSLVHHSLKSTDVLYAIYENSYLVGFVNTRENSIIDVYIEPWVRGRGLAHFAINQVANIFVRTYGVCTAYIEDYGLITPINILSQINFEIHSLIVNNL